MKYVVTTPDGYAVGPFKSENEAKLYVASDYEKHEMQVLDLVPPARGWKQQLAITKVSPPKDGDYFF